jgi:hypothetical protein
MAPKRKAKAKAELKLESLAREESAELKDDEKTQPQPPYESAITPQVQTWPFRRPVPIYPEPLLPQQQEMHSLTATRYEEAPAGKYPLSWNETHPYPGGPPSELSQLHAQQPQPSMSAQQPQGQWATWIHQRVRRVGPIQTAAEISQKTGKRIDPARLAEYVRQTAPPIDPSLHHGFPMAQSTQLQNSYIDRSSSSLNQPYDLQQAYTASQKAYDDEQQVSLFLDKQRFCH